jgi:hypothetical protein
MSGMSKIFTYFASLKSLAAWLLCAILLVFLVFNRHSNTGTYNWLTPLWADQSGYYVYLPALFIYDFDAGSFPDGIEAKTGDGFSLDTESNKVITRYSCGVAILQAPFFIAIHFLAGILGQTQDGFSGIYHQVPNIAAIFYALLGFIFLWKFLKHYFNSGIRFFVITALFFGTNLYYYTIDSTGMSHIYSFGLFALAVWLTKRLLASERRNHYKYLAVWGFIFSLIVLVRPSNVLFFPFLFCLDCSSAGELIKRIKKFATVKNILLTAAIFSVVSLPQFIYWKYVSGSYIYYSYEGYGFTNWKTPGIIELWFSPNNGLFLYSPLYLAVLAGIFLMIRNKIENGWMILLTFCALSYLFASWFMFSFGCGFGSRNFVEYTVMFSLPLGYLYKRIGDYKKIRNLLIIALIAVMVLFNIRLVYRYSRCFQGGDWDFTEYVSFLKPVRKFHKELELNSEYKLTPEKEFSKILTIPLNKLYYMKFNKAVVRSKVTIQDKNSEALLVFAVDNPDSLFYWNSIKLKDKIPDSKINKLHTVTGEFGLPLPLPENSKISAYIWNMKGEYITIEKFELFLE